MKHMLAMFAALACLSLSAGCAHTPTGHGGADCPCGTECQHQAGGQDGCTGCEDGACAMKKNEAT